MQQIILNGIGIDDFRNIVKEEVNKAIKTSIPQPPPKLYTRTETAKRLCISLPTLDNYIRNGWLKAKRVNNRSIRISEDAIQEALQTVKTLKSRNQL